MKQDMLNINGEVEHNEADQYHEPVRDGDLVQHPPICVFGIERHAHRYGRQDQLQQQRVDDENA